MAVLVVGGLLLPSGVLLKGCRIVPDATAARGKQGSNVWAVQAQVVANAQKDMRHARLPGTLGCQAKQAQPLD